MTDHGPEWKRIGIFPPNLLPKFINMANVGLHQRVLTRANSDGEEEDEKHEYQCKRRKATCPVLYHAERKANATNFNVWKRGQHNCEDQQQKQQPKKAKVVQPKQPQAKIPGLSFDGWEQIGQMRFQYGTKQGEQWLREHYSVLKLPNQKRINLYRSFRCTRATKFCNMCIRWLPDGSLWQRPDPKHVKHLKPGRNNLEMEKEEESDEELELDESDEPSEESDVESEEEIVESEQEEEEVVENTAMDLDLVEQPGQLGLLLPGSAERSSGLEEMAGEIGLKFSGFVDDDTGTEQYFIMPKKAGHSKAQTIVEIDIQRSSVANFAPMALILAKYGVRGSNASYKFLWQLVDLPHFLWAIRGLCHETFFQSVRLQKDSGHRSPDSDVLPEVYEPEDEEEGEENGTARVQEERQNFSIMEAHPELRLEEVAADLLLQLKRTSKFGVDRLVLEPLGGDATRLMFTESEKAVEACEYRGRRKEEAEQWPKLDRVQFRYAFMGAAMKVFGLEEG